MLIVPIQPVPNQTFSCLLANQSCQITLSTGACGVLFMTLAVNNVPLVENRVCENLNRIVRYAYLAFTGDFWFSDQQGSDDPIYTGLGSRFLLEYLEASDLEP
jgi:hypothetical protein